MNPEQVLRLVAASLKADSFAAAPDDTFFMEWSTGPCIRVELTPRNSIEWPKWKARVVSTYGAQASAEIRSNSFGRSAGMLADKIAAMRAQESPAEEQSANTPTTQN